MHQVKQVEVKSKAKVISGKSNDILFRIDICLEVFVFFAFWKKFLVPFDRLYGLNRFGGEGMLLFSLGKNLLQNVSPKLATMLEREW